MGKGFLIVELRVGDYFMPVVDAKVVITDYAGKKYELRTDENGNTRRIEFEAPDIGASLNPNAKTPVYSMVDVEVPFTKGYMKVIVHNVQIFDTETSILPVQMTPAVENKDDAFNTKEIFIPTKHGVNIDDNGQGMIETEIREPSDDIFMQELQLANEVAIPAYITVHLGSPNTVAQNVRVPFRDYIKNVASSEIFPTWPEAAIRANIYAQISFALNRFYTVWYRSRGYEFDITNSTAFDQFFVYGREIFANISDIVDGIFNSFIRRAGRREPFFASYCNGTTSQCAGLSQWGTVTLAQNGYSPIQILRHYYPNDIQIVVSTNFTERIGTYGGVPLREGSTGNDVRTMQLYLNRISGNYPAIPWITNPNGFFGSGTTAAVKVFQTISNLVPDGIIGQKTWYSINFLYVAVRRLAELDSEGERLSIGLAPPTTVVQMGSRGEYVVELQFLLNFISEFFPMVPFVIENGVFTDDTKRSVVEFQKFYSLTPDGIVGPQTWIALYDTYKSIRGTTAVLPPFPGTLLRVGSRGSDVELMQKFLNAISVNYPSIPAVTADGIFGPMTEAAVKAFQRQFGLTVDGIIGSNTWTRIATVYNELGVSPPVTPPVTPAPPFPGTVLRIGSRGDDVLLMQRYLNGIARSYPSIPILTEDGIFGARTDSAVRVFQGLFGLTVDGIIGQMTWDKIVSVYRELGSTYSVSGMSAKASHPDLGRLALIMALGMSRGARRGNWPNY